MSTKPQKKHRFTIFDAIFMVLIAAVLALAAYMLIVSPAKDKGTPHQLEFVVEMPTTTYDISELVKVGDKVSLLGKDSATVTKVEAKAARKLVLDSISGKYKYSIVPEKFDVLVTLTGDAVETEREIAIGSTPIRIGSTMSVEGRGYSINGAVIDMELTDTLEEVDK